MPCDICSGRKIVSLRVQSEVSAVDWLKDDAPPDVAPSSSKQFPCPQCCMVPFRQVRAMKVTTAYPAEVFGKMQMPIERGLAARFGEYLHREGLITFTTSGTKDLGPVTDKITVTAHLGVVTRADTRRAGAAEEVAMAPAPPLPSRLRARLNVSERATRWVPPILADEPVEQITDEFDEPKDALGARFSGLEI